MADVTDQLLLNLKINEAIKERSVLMEKQRSLIIDQIALSRELCSAMECIDTDGMEENILKTKEALEGLFKASEKLDKVPGKFDNAKKAMAGLAAGATATVAWWKTMGKVIGSVTGKIGTFVKGAWSIVKSLGQVAKSIISIPFKMMEGLIDLSNKFGRFTEFEKALENVREKFGDLEKGTSRILKNSMAPMREQFGKLAAAGHGFASTFGRGPAGMARALEFNAELMEKLNGGTERLRNEIGQNIGAMAIYRKGMGFTAEQQATLVALADAQGKNIMTVQHEYAKFSLGMAKRFGLDSKLIGKAMADMTADVGNFGTLSTKQLAQVATYTQKLGIETKALQGIVKKYDDFESAAKSAAMLNQTFGMQVDVLKMLKDEDPASRLSQLQKSFQATGKSYESLSRAERKRMAELAGLDDKSAELAFSQKGLSMSYEDVQAAGEETDTSFKDINETLKEISKNMKKVLEEPQDFKSFFGAFTRGFQKGLILSKPFMTIMRNLRQSLTIVERAGKQVGKAFVEMFPGVKQALTGLGDFFNPGTTRQRMSKVVSSFKEFFRTLQDGPAAARKAVGKLWDDLSGNFTSFFGGKSGTTSKIFEGLKTFGAVLGNVALNFGIKVIENVSKGLKVVGEFFNNLKGGMQFGDALEQAIGMQFDVGGFFSDAFGDAASSLADVVMNDLWPALRDALLVMFDYLYNDVLSPFWSNTLSPWLSSLWSDYVAPFFMSLGSMIIDTWLGAVKEYWNEGSVLKAAGLFLGPILLLFGPVLASLLGPVLSGLGTLIGAKLAVAGKAAAASGTGLAVLGVKAILIAKGAAAVAAAITLIGGAVALVGGAFALAIWAIAEALDVFADSLGKLAQLDGENLLKVGAGIMAVAGGIGAMGAATAASAIGGVVGGVVNTIGAFGSGVKDFFTGEETTKKTGIAGIVEDLKAFSSSEIEPDKIQKNADAIKIFTGAMATFTLFNATTAKQAMTNAGIVLEDNPFLSMQNEIDAFSALNLNRERIKDVADSISVFSEALQNLSMARVPDDRTWWEKLNNSSPNLQSINSIKAQISAFNQITIADEGELKKKFEFVKVFAEAMKGFAESMNLIAGMKIPRIRKEFITDALGNFTEGSNIANLKIHVTALKSLADDLDGFDQKAQRIKAFIEVMTNIAEMRIPKINDGKGWLNKDTPVSDIGNLSHHIPAITSLASQIPIGIKSTFDDKILPFAEAMNKLAGIKIAEFEGIAKPEDSKINYLANHIKALEELEFRPALIKANAESITEFAKVMETLKDIDKISDMNFDSENLENIRRQTKILVDNLNEVFKSTQAELTKLTIDESFKTDLFNNKILSNMQGIIQLKADVKKLAESGPTPRTIKTNMTNFKESLVEIQKQVGEVGLKASQIVTTLGAGAGATGLQGIGTIVSDLNTAASSLKEFQNPKNRVSATEIGKSMTAMDGGLQAMSTGLDAMKDTIKNIGEKFGSHAAKEEALGMSFAPDKDAFDVSASLEPIDDIITSVKGTMDLLKSIQDTGLDDAKMSRQIRQLETSLCTIRNRMTSFATNLGTTDQVREMTQNVEKAVNFFKTLSNDLGELRGSASDMINNIKLAVDINKQIKAVQSMEKLEPRTIQTKISDMKDAAGAFSAGIQNMMTGDGAVKITVEQKNLLQDLSNATTNYLSAIESLKRISAARINVGDLTTKMESIESLFNMVLNVKDDLHEIDYTMQLLTGEPINTEASNRYVNSISNLLSEVRYVMINFSNHLPESVIAKAEQTVEAVKRMDANFRELAATPVVATAIAIGESFKGGGTVTFRHENININLAVNVEMSAEQIARGVMKAKVKGTEGKADVEVSVVTNPSNPDFD